MRRVLGPVVLAAAGLVVAACFPQPTTPTTTTTTTTTTVAPVSHLVVTVSTADTTPPYFSQFVATATVHNDGPDGATGVTASIDLPDGVSFIGAPSAYDSGTGTWTIGSLAAGADATLPLTLRAGDVALGARTITASAGASTGQLSITPSPAVVAVTINPDPANPPVVDISAPASLAWSASAVNAANASAPIAGLQYFWSCDTSSGDPCPFAPNTGQTYSLEINSLQIDQYFITLTVSASDPNYAVGAWATTISFATTNSGGA